MGETIPAPRFPPGLERSAAPCEKKEKTSKTSTASDDTGNVHVHVDPVVSKQDFYPAYAQPTHFNMHSNNFYLMTDNVYAQKQGHLVDPLTQPMLIDFDAPEYARDPQMTSAPSSTLTYSSTLLDMDDMLELKTPITSPDRRVVGLDVKVNATKASYQKTFDVGQLARMFENGYPV
jgi:hypothetical protein